MTTKLDLTPYLLESGKVQSYAFPGGYPIYFVCADGGALCPKCVNDNRDLVDNADESDKQWMLVGADVNYEDDCLSCDNCGEIIESAYGDGDDDN